MKRTISYIFSAVFLALTLSIPHFAYADSGFTISDFSSTLHINADGTVNVREVISADFTTAKHGIYRDIPYAYQNSDGSTYYTNINIQSVTDNGTDTQYSVTQNDANEEIKIGDPNNLVTGSQVYTISYVAIGILQDKTSVDQLAWNVTGTNWGVPIAKATATISLPSSSLTEVSCSQGPDGSTEKCTSSISQNDGSGAFTTTRSLQSGEGMTIIATYPHGFVPILKGTPPYTYTSSDYTNAGITFSIVVALFALLIFYINRKQNLRENPSGRDTIMAVYDPPLNLRPAEIGMLLDEKPTTTACTATIVDLASRGYLTISEVETKSLLGKNTDYTLHRTDKVAGDELMTYEKTLLDGLFPLGKVDSTLSTLKFVFQKTLIQVNAQIIQNAKDKGHIVSKFFNARIICRISGIILLLNFIFVLPAFTTPEDPTTLAFGSFFAGLVAGGILLIIASTTLSIRTPEGHAAYVQAAGYKLFLSSTEKYRQPFLERQNIFESILSYAIIFGVTKKLAKAFQDLGVQPQVPTWYYAANGLNFIDFSNHLDSFTTQLSTTMASTPSGGIGSGGGVGGGFGGGGGGSW